MLDRSCLLVGSWLGRVARFTAHSRTCGVVVGALAVVLATCWPAKAADNLNRIADTLLEITNRARHAGDTAYGSSAAEILHLKCSVHDQEEACNKLISQARKPRFASIWSVAVAYVSRGEFKEARKDLRGALQDYVQAQRLYNKFPKLHLSIARVEKALSRANAREARMAADRERAKAATLAAEHAKVPQDAKMHRRSPAINKTQAQASKVDRISAGKVQSKRVSSQSITTGTLPSNKYTSRLSAFSTGKQQTLDEDHETKIVDSSRANARLGRPWVPSTILQRQQSSRGSHGLPFWLIFVGGAVFLITAHLGYMIYRTTSQQHRGMAASYKLGSNVLVAGAPTHATISLQDLVRPESIVTNAPANTSKFEATNRSEFVAEPGQAQNCFEPPLVEVIEPLEASAPEPAFEVGDVNEPQGISLADVEETAQQDCSFQEPDPLAIDERVGSLVQAPISAEGTVFEEAAATKLNEQNERQLDSGIKPDAGCSSDDLDEPVQPKGTEQDELEGYAFVEALKAAGRANEFQLANLERETERSEPLARVQGDPPYAPETVKLNALLDVSEPVQTSGPTREGSAVKQFEPLLKEAVDDWSDAPEALDFVEPPASLAVERMLEPVGETVTVEQAEPLLAVEPGHSLDEIDIVEFIELPDLPEASDMSGDGAGDMPESVHESVAVESANPETSHADGLVEVSADDERIETFIDVRSSIQAKPSLFLDFSQEDILEELQSGLSVCEDVDLATWSSNDEVPLTHTIALAVCVDVLRKRDGFQLSAILKLRLYEVSRLLAQTDFDNEAYQPAPSYLTGRDLTDEDWQTISAWSCVLVAIWDELLRHIPNCVQPQDHVLSTEEASFPLLGQIQKPLLVPMILMKSLHQPVVVDAGYFTKLRLALIQNTNKLGAEHGLEGDQVFQWLTGTSEPHHERAVEIVLEVVSDTEFAHFFDGTIDATISVAEIDDNCCVVGSDAATRSLLLSDLLAPKLDRVLNDELSILIVDSHGELQKSVERRIFNQPGVDLEKRFAAINLEASSGCGLFNPFRIDLTHSNALVMERLLGEAFEIECFVLEAFLGPEVTQDHRSDLRHVMRLLHAMPDPDLSTLLRLSDRSTFQELEKYISQIGNASSRKYFADSFDSQSFRELAHHIHKKLDGLLSDPAFSRATTGTVPANHPIKNADLGRVVLLNLAAEEMCPVRTEVLKRTLIGNMAIERLMKSALPGDHQSMIICVDDVSECFGQSSAEFDLMLGHVKKLDGQICLGHKNSDRLTSDLLRPDFRGLPIILAGNFALHTKDLVAD